MQPVSLLLPDEAATVAPPEKAATLPVIGVVPSPPVTGAIPRTVAGFFFFDDGWFSEEPDPTFMIEL